MPRTHHAGTDTDQPTDHLTNMILTRNDIQAGASSKGGWSKKQIECLGLDWTDMRKGWLSALVGTEIDDSLYAQFLSLRNLHLNDKTPMFPKVEQPSLVSRIESLERNVKELRAMIPSGDDNPESAPWNE